MTFSQIVAGRSVTCVSVIAAFAILVFFSGTAEALVLADATTPEKPAAGPTGSLQGFGFGVAIGASWQPQNDVQGTIVQNNLLQLSKGGKSDVGFWAETHAWVISWDEAKATKADGTKQSVYKQGLGIFVGAQLGTDDKIVQALGVGLMYGVRVRPDSDQSVNIGIGISARQINELTNGLSLGQPLPTGLTAATTHSVYVASPMLITSFAF